MPKSYQVGDTAYQFPDDFDDAKVQDILTKQGIIKSADPIGQTKAAFEAQAPMSIADKALTAAKQIGSAAIAPIAGIPDAVRAVADFLKNPNEWAKRHFDASKAQLAPGEMGSDPVNEAASVVAPLSAGVAIGDMAPAAGRAVKAGARAVGSAVGGIADNPVARDIVGVISPRAGRALDTAASIREALKKRQANRPQPASVPQSTEGIPPVAEESGPIATPASDIESALQQSLDAIKSQRGASNGASGKATESPVDLNNPHDAPAILDLRRRYMAGESISPAEFEFLQRRALVPEGSRYTSNGQTAAGDAYPRSGTGDIPAKGAVAESGNLEADPSSIASRDVSPKQDSIRTKGMGQAMKDATALVDKLAEWEFTPDQVKGEAMNAKSWAKLAHDSGVPVPTTAAAKARVWEQLSRRLAGPPRTVQGLIQGLQESLKGSQ